MVCNRLSNAGMSVSAPKKSHRPILTALTILFCAAFFIAIMRGGMCERYERKMDRMNSMRQYIDSMRTDEQLKKIR
ncbi:hypothetical protein BH10BAC6_BH10BAC6_16200 [soil metagenome]